MAQQVQLMGAIYNAVPAIMLPDSNNVMHRFDDASITTATASDVASGKVFLANDGTITTGTSSGGGGSSSWTLVASTSYQVSTTSTSAAAVATWSTGHSEIWTSEKIVCVLVRDTAGTRSGYFYGGLFFRHGLPDSTSSSSSAMTIGLAYRYTTVGSWAARYCYGTTAYGVYPDTFYSNGDIRIRSRYSSTYSLTIDGTYSVDVYLIDPPTNAPIFT